VDLSLPIASDAEKRIAFSYHITRFDFVEFSVFRANRPRSMSRYRTNFFVNFLIWMVAGFVIMAVFGKFVRSHVSSNLIFIFCAVVFIVGISCFVFRRWFLRAAIRRSVGSQPGATFEGVVDFVMDGRGIDCGSDGSHTAMEWRTLQRVEETSTHVFLMMSDIQGLIIPKRDLSPELVSEIVRFSAERIALSSG
jgi:hypothetical protein